MDAFFASLEQRDFPELKGKPVAVGGNKDRGVVAAASYEARKFGVRSAMSSRLAFKKCPNIIFCKPRFEVYKEVSTIIHSIFSEYTDLIEPLSLDEAYLDVSENKKGIKSATVVAKQIRAEIFAATGLTASAGISSNKFVAKIASDINKPNGYCLVHPSKIEKFIENLPVSKFYGVGKVTCKKMNSLGIIFGNDLKKLSLEFLTQNFGKLGRHYFNISRGIDNRQVNPSRIRKSIGGENTFNKDLYLDKDLQNKIETISKRVFERLNKSGAKPKTITLKVKFSDFTQITRSYTDPNFTFTEEKQILNAAQKLLILVEIPKTGIRLLGISLSNFEIVEVKKVAKQLTIDF